MSKPCFKAFLTGIFLLLPTFALADVTTDQDAPNTPQPFSFYCEPYKLPFEESKHYIVKPVGRADNLASCYYTIPQTAPLKFIGIYKGTVGSSTQVSNDLTIFNPKSSLRTFPNVFHEPQNEDQFFTVAFSAATGPEIMAGDTYFQTGVGSPPADATILNWKWGPKPASEFDPVIIIPGILGSWEKNGQWVLDPIGKTYNELIDTFKSSGYKTNLNLFEFGYNWRDSNASNAVILAQAIQNIKQICNCSHVDIVAHSMGGLVAREYMENSYYQNDVDQVIFIAVPHLGAPFAYQTWEAGELDFGDPIENGILKTLFQLEALHNGYLTIFDYIRGRSVLSINELLPIYNYLNNSNSSLVYPSGYPKNAFLEDLNSDIGLLLERKVRTINILGDTGATSTIGGYIVGTSTQLPKWEHGQPTKTIFTTGDGTVPRKSIEDAFGVDREFSGTGHNKIVASSTKYVFEILNNRESSPITIGTQIYRTFEDISNILSIKLFSPIDMEIIAPDGKRMGRNIDGSGESNEIPDAFYSGFNTDNEYAVIVNPLPGEYKIRTLGTGSGGHYEIVVDYIDINGFVESETNGTTTPAEVINNSVTLSTTSRTVQIVKVEAPTPTLEELLAALKVKIQTLDIKKQLKDNLLKKIEKIEKKIEKQKKKKATQTVVNLEQKILKKGQKGKLTDADAQEVLDLLDQIERAL